MSETSASTHDADRVMGDKVLVLLERTNARMHRQRWRLMNRREIHDILHFEESIIGSYVREPVDYRFHRGIYHESSKVVLYLHFVADLAGVPTH